MDDIDPINVEVHAALAEAIGEIQQVCRTDGVRPTSFQAAVLATSLLRRGVTFGPAPAVKTAEPDRLAAIEARLDALEAPKATHPVIIDCDGDLWKWDPDREGYSTDSICGEGVYSRDRIASLFGIRKVLQ